MINFKNCRLGIRIVIDIEMIIQDRIIIALSSEHRIKPGKIKAIHLLPIEARNNPLGLVVNSYSIDMIPRVNAVIIRFTVLLVLVFDFNLSTQIYPALNEKYVEPIMLRSRNEMAQYILVFRVVQFCDG